MEQALIPLGFGVASGAATYFGGALALGFQRRASLLLGLAAGVVLGVALFDLVPEAMAAVGGADPGVTLAYVGLGLGAYLLLDRLLGATLRDGSRWRTHLGPASLTLHSLLDGMGVGLAFQLAPEAGWTVALAVLTHDLADGVNTVSLTAMNAGDDLARRWLLTNAAAPVLGVVLGLITTVPPVLLGPLLACFAGAFLYIGACELVPRSHARDPRFRVTLASVGGMALMLLVTRWAE